MTKAELLKVLEGLPDDAPILSHFDESSDLMGYPVYRHVSWCTRTVRRDGNFYKQSNSSSKRIKSVRALVLG